MKRILFYSLAGLMIFAVSWFACDGDGGVQVDGIGGTVTYKDGTTPVYGATVTAISTTALSATYTATSGYDGKFSMPTVADGTYNVTADKGPFHTQGEVTVSGGKSMALTMALDLSADKIGVVPGLYDDIGAILTDLGYAYTTLSDSDLADSGNLDPLVLLFLNCGSSTFWATDATVQANLQDYVNTGGYLYASDWDYEYVENCWPSAIDFIGKDGEGSQTVTADVVDTELAGYLGKNTAEIFFDLESWVVMNGVDPSTNILVQGDVNTYSGMLNDKPIMVSFAYGSGIVAYTSFHNEAQLTGDGRQILNYFISLLE